MREKQSVMRELKQLPTFNMVGTKKEVSYLPEILNPDERVLGLISGFLDGNTWIIALTDRRVIFLDKGMLYGLKQRELPLDKINSISQKRGLLLGSITIQDGASAIKIENIDKGCIGSFVDSLNAAIDSYKFQSSPVVQSSNVSGADEILKFKSLLDQGIITRDEFEIKKRQILGL